MSQSRRSIRSASNDAAHLAEWEARLASEGMPADVPMVNALPLSYAHNLACERNVAYVGRDESSVGWDRQYVDICETASPRSFGAQRQVNLADRGLSMPRQATPGSDAWSDGQGRRLTALLVTDVRAPHMGTLPTTVGKSGKTWAVVDVAVLADVSGRIVAAREGRRAPRGSRAKDMGKVRARRSAARPVQDLRLVASGRGLSAALARWESATVGERVEVCASLGIDVGSVWGDVRSAAVAALPAAATGSTLADALAVCAVRF